jgi:hypothetical protein
VNDYPAAITAVNHVEPVPRRIRAFLADFTTRQLQPIAGLVAFYNEKVDLFLCGQRLERPKTHFFASTDSPDTP